MALQQSYPASVNSRQTELAGDINDTQKSFEVLDGSVLPDAPNQLTLGTDESAETILYTGKSGNQITGVTRGFEGTAKSWVAGTKLARYFTAYDHDTFRQNVSDLNERLDNIPEPQDASLTQKGIVQLSNSTVSNSEAEAATPKAVNDARIGIISDYIRQPGYAVTTGTSTAYAVILNPVPSSLPDGFGITIIPHATNGANPTLNVNGLGAAALKDQKGVAYAAGKLAVGRPYTFRKVGSDFLADSGSSNGTAQPAQVLAGATFGNDSGDQVGTMVDRGAMQFLPSASDQTIPEGYHNGLGLVKGGVVIAPGNSVVASTTNTKTLGYDVPTKSKEIRVNQSGSYRVRFDLVTNSSTYTARAQIYVNGVARGLIRSIGTSRGYFIEDFLNLTAGDLVQLYMWSNPAGGATTNTDLSIMVEAGTYTVALS